MKKFMAISISLALLALPLMLGAAAKGNPAPKTSCVNIAGKYTVTQLVKTLNCAKGGAAVKVNHPTEALPEQSTLSITEKACVLTASEDKKSLSVVIPYSGTATKASTLSLASQNLEELALPLSLGIGNETVKCAFKGHVTFAGDVPGSGNLKGKVIYSLQKRTDANAACPDTCSVVSDFQATTK
jgi:hypothetical protein